MALKQCYYHIKKKKKTGSILYEILSIIKIITINYLKGGGSGHEPFASGFVGFGALTASVVGGVFASPTSQSILDVIDTCLSSLIDDGATSSGKPNVSTDNGVLLIVTNYTGVYTH